MVDQIFSYDGTKRKEKSGNHLDDISNVDKMEYLLSNSTDDLLTNNFIHKTTDKDGDSNLPGTSKMGLEDSTSETNLHSLETHNAMFSTQYINTHYDITIPNSREIREEVQTPSNYETNSPNICENSEIILPQKLREPIYSNQEDCWQKNQGIDDRRTTVAQIFSAMESDELDRLRIIAHGICNFNRLVYFFC